ncbi:S-layer homology domain-containing protein [Bacillus songklensis]|uniref:S-layer homology domain-containing protein n=1 Tax=Bacillus songklensis TaxID=1069116 RepID=A0ABV8B9B0_9BACI
MKRKKWIVWSACCSLFALSACSAETAKQETKAAESVEVASVDWAEAEVGKVDAKANEVSAKADELKHEVDMLLAQQQNSLVFTDVPKSYWAYSNIMSLYEKGIIQGYPEEKKFYPERTITRYQAASMLIKAFNLPLSNSPSVFKDVPDTHPNVREVMTVYEAGFFKGSNGYFGLNDSMKRKHMALVLQRAFELKDNGTTVKDYADVSRDMEAYEAIKVISQYGIATGSNGYFKPEDPTKRSQFSAFVDRALKMQP